MQRNSNIAEAVFVLGAWAGIILALLWLLVRDVVRWLN